MILVDTNVISELLKSEPNKNVLKWIDNQNIEALYLSAITVSELRYGIAIMPSGKRKNTYSNRLEKEFLFSLIGRILSFDLNTSNTYANMMAIAKLEGKAISKEDGYIAATAIINKLKIATRDIKPFLAVGLKVINPWISDEIIDITKKIQ